MGGLGKEWVGTVMRGFRWCWLGSVSTMVGGFGWADRWWVGSAVGGFGWARLWVPMDGSVVGGFWWVSNKTQAEASSQVDLYRIGFSFLFCCDLMVDSAIVVWVVGRHFGSAFSALSFTLYSAFSAYQTLL